MSLKKIITKEALLKHLDFLKKIKNLKEKSISTNGDFLDFILTILSQNCLDAVVLKIKKELIENDLLTYDKIIANLSLFKKIIKKTGNYERKLKTILINYYWLFDGNNRLKKSRLKNVHTLPGIGIKSKEVLLEKSTLTNRIVVDVNVQKSFNCYHSVSYSPVLIHKIINASLGEELGGSYCGLLWTQRKNYCNRRNCTYIDLCIKCKDFYNLNKIDIIN